MAALIVEGRLRGSGEREARDVVNDLTGECNPRIGRLASSHDIFLLLQSYKVRSL